MKLSWAVACRRVRATELGARAARVLIVEQRASRLARLVAALELDGYEVLQARSAGDLLEHFGSILVGETRPLDAVLDDVGCAAVLLQLGPMASDLAVVRTSRATSASAARRAVRAVVPATVAGPRS